MSAIYVRVCKVHRVELVPDTLTCPVGHECGEEEFLSREREGIERSQEQSRSVRDGLMWAAGVFDAHGSCAVSSYAATRGGKRYLRPVVRIRSRDKMILDMVKRLTGIGNVTTQRPRQSLAGLGQKRTSYRFQALNSSATRFLLAVKPYLRVKKIAVDKLLSGRVQGRCE